MKALQRFRDSEQDTEVWRGLIEPFPKLLKMRAHTDLQFAFKSKQLIMKISTLDFLNLHCIIFVKDFTNFN